MAFQMISSLNLCMHFLFTPSGPHICPIVTFFYYPNSNKWLRIHKILRFVISYFVHLLHCSYLSILAFSRTFLFKHLCPMFFESKSPFFTAIMYNAKLMFCTYIFWFLLLRKIISITESVELFNNKSLLKLFSSFHVWFSRSYSLKVYITKKF
jgi:hypothetical protein